jgi:SAM-dependent methyltransferase
MASVDVYGRTQELDKATLDAIVTRLEYRAKQPVFIKILDEYLDRLSLTSIHNLLDLGCGTGFAPRTIAQRSEFQGHITGIDISPGLIGGGTTPLPRRWCFRPHRIPCRRHPFARLSGRHIRCGHRPHAGQSCRRSFRGDQGGRPHRSTGRMGRHLRRRLRLPDVWN